VKKTLSIVFISLLFTNNALAKEQLIFTVDLVRHGDRTPIQQIPKSPHLWKEGLGELTPEGMKQEFELGTALRKKYIDEYHLLPSHYASETMYVRSTDYNRTLMSAESLLFGLYPLGTGSPSLPSEFQPVPIHTVPKSKENLLEPSPSKNIFSLASLYFDIHRAWKNKTASMQTELKTWSDATGFNLNDPHELDKLSDNLNVRRFHHIAYPAGITDTDAEKIISLGQLAVTTYFKYKEVSYPMGYRFLNTVADYIKNASDKKTPLKYVLFLGHDVSIMSVMTTLGQPLEKMPPYASRLNFSLFQDNDKQYIKITLNDQPVTIPACGGNVCSLKQFSTLVNQ